jgi:tetrahydromethanopterin S-methyltransferase subunit G
MDMTSFWLGVCAVTVLTAVTVVVVGMFKISRLNKELNNLERLVDTVVNQLDQRITSTDDYFRRMIDSKVDIVRSVIEKEHRFIHERIDKSKQEVVDEIKFVHERIDGVNAKIAGLGKVK